jgi:ankyrin repeat protein
MIGQTRPVIIGLMLVVVCCVMPISSAEAQVPPSSSDSESYRGLHRAAHEGDAVAIRKLAREGADREARDRAGRTPLHVAVFASRDKAVRALADAGADLNTLEDRAYDVVTIAAVANDLDMLDLCLTLGASPGNITSPYDGTALIAAAHLGHDDVVKRLIEGGAPLDHVNNLNWTALIEAVVLGDGGPDHIETVRALIEAGADQTITDREGVSPLEHAKARGFEEMVAIMEAAK